MCASAYFSLYVLCVVVCVCVISNQTNSKNNVINSVKPSVNLLYSYIKHTKVRKVYVDNIIKQNNTLDMA